MNFLKKQLTKEITLLMLILPMAAWRAAPAAATCCGKSSGTLQWHIAAVSSVKLATPRKNRQFREHGCFPKPNSPVLACRPS